MKEFLSVAVGTSHLWYALTFTIGFTCSKEPVLTIMEESVVLDKPFILEVQRGEICEGLVNASMLLISQECLTNQCCYWLADRLDGLSFVDW